MNKAKIIIWSITALLVTGSMLYLKRQYDLLTNYCYKFKDVVIERLSLADSSLKFVIEFTNKSKLKARVESYDIDIFVNSKKVGKAASNQPIVIDAAKKFNMAFGVKFNTKDVFSLENLWAVIESSQDVAKFKIAFKGNINLSIAGNTIKVQQPVDIVYTLADIVKMAQQPSTQVSGCA
jgi:LEA14-like dessication related protein